MEGSRRVAWALSGLASVALALSGCGGGAAKSAAGSSTASPAEATSANDDPRARDSSASREGSPLSSSESRCAALVGMPFAKCLDAMYQAGKYASMVRTCDAALRGAEARARSQAEKGTIAEVCITLLPAALWISNERKDATSLVAGACDRATDTARVDRAARETLLLIRGLGRVPGAEEDKKQSMKDALVAFASGCQVDPQDVAKRILDLDKGGAD